MAEGDEMTTPTALPRGPHGLSREQVERSQRDRLLMGAAEAVAEKGYAATSVADIIGRAGVSRTTFYQLFDGKLDCFLAAARMASDVLVEVVAGELVAADADSDSDSDSDSGSTSTPLERLDRLLTAYLRTLADNPVLARVFLVEVYAAGGPAIRQRREVLDRFVDVLAETYGDSPGVLGSSGEQRFAAEVLVAAVSSMVTTMVGVGESDRLPDLREPLMRLAAQLASTAGEPTR